MKKWHEPTFFPSHLRPRSLTRCCLRAPILSDSWQPRWPGNPCVSRAPPGSSSGKQTGTKKRSISFFWFDLIGAKLEMISSLRTFLAILNSFKKHYPGGGGSIEQWLATCFRTLLPWVWLPAFPKEIQREKLSMFPGLITSGAKRKVDSALKMLIKPIKHKIALQKTLTLVCLCWGVVVQINVED